MKTSIPRLLLLSLFFVFSQATAFGQATATSKPPLYDDERIKTWSKAYLDQKFEEVIGLVQDDLRSDHPHPFAPHVWTICQATLGRLAVTWEGLKDAKLRKAIGPLPDIYLDYEKGEYKKILSKFPPDRASEIEEVWALHYLAFSASHEHRFHDMFVYTTTMAKLRPDLFQGSWATVNAYEDDERLRPKIAALIRQGGELAGTPFARFNEQIVNVQPPSNKAYIDAIKGYLKEYPNDARALRFYAEQLKQVSKPKEAAEYYEKSVQAYPFKTVRFPNWDTEATALLKVKDEAEASRVIARSAQFEAKEYGQDPLAIEKVRYAFVLRAVDRQADAIKILEDALKRWPESAWVNAELAAFYLSSEDKKSEALPFARKAVDLDKDNQPYQVQLIKALHSSGDSVKAYALFETVESCSQKSPELYGAAETIFLNPKTTSEKGLFEESTAGADLRNKEWLNLATRAVAEYPGSGWMLRLHSQALYENHNYREALTSLKRSFEIDAPFSWSVTMLNKILNEIAGDNVPIRDTKYALIEKYPWNQLILKETEDDLSESIEKYRPEVPDLLAHASRAERSQPETTDSAAEKLTDLLVFDYPYDSGILFYDYEGDVLRKWLVTAEGIASYHQATIPITRLNSLASRFYESFRGPVEKNIATSTASHAANTPNGLGNGSSDPGKELSDILFPPPLVRQLTENTTIKRLIIIPPKGIHPIPFGALQPGTGGQLIDKYAVSMAGSVSDLMQRVEPWAAEVNDSLLVQGSTTRATHKAGDVSKLFKMKSSMDSVPPNEKAFERIRMADVLFFSDAMARSSSTDCLVFRTPNGVQTRWTPQQIQDAQLNARLVVMSGYATGDAAVSTTPMELTKALQKAGVTQVVVSLWPIDAQAADQFMEFFTSELEDAYPVDALRKATLRFKKERPNSLDWASFMLIGSSRLRNTFRPTPDYEKFER